MKETKKVELELVLANKKDFVEFKSFKKEGGKVYGMKYGVPYWMINSKGEIEQLPYRTHEEMNLVEFADYMQREQILIIKDNFKKN